MTARSKGHSDADVVLHALVDAILGALGDGDIGSHFPPSDPKWRGAASDRFLQFAIERVKARGGMVAHLDTTIVCEAPKIGPHRDAMRARIAQIAGISIDRVGVKATTSEGLGFTGRGEGIAAYATRHDPAAKDAQRCLMTISSPPRKRLLDICRRKKLTDRDRGILHRRACRRHADGNPRRLQHARARFHHLQQPGEAGHARRSRGNARNNMARSAAKPRKRWSKGALAHAPVDLAVSVTGIAGPDSDSAEKPVGLVHFARRLAVRPTQSCRETIRQSRTRGNPQALCAAGLCDAARACRKRAAPTAEALRPVCARRSHPRAARRRPKISGTRRRTSPPSACRACGCGIRRR